MSQFSGKTKQLFEKLFAEKNLLKTTVSALGLSFLVISTISDTFFGNPMYGNMGSIIIVSGLIWLGIFDSILEISSNRAQLRREFTSGNGLGVGACLASVVIFRILHGIAEGLCMLLAILVLFDMPELSSLAIGTVPDLAITLLLVAVVSQLTGLAVSAWSPSDTAALKAAPIVLIFELVFSNMMVAIPDSVEFLSNATVCRWGVEAVGSIFNLTIDSGAFEATASHLQTTWLWMLGLGAACVVISFLGLLVTKITAKS